MFFFQHHATANGMFYKVDLYLKCANTYYLFHKKEDRLSRRARIDLSLTGAEGQLLDQGRYSVVLGLVQQLLDVHPVEREGPGAQVVEDDPEEVGVAVDEDGAVVVAQATDAPGQQGREERLLVVDGPCSTSSSSS